jgi:uncharacterized protein YoxC
MPANAQSNPNFFNLPASFTDATAALVDAQSKPTKSASNLPIVSTQPNKPTSKNVDENNKKGSTNISIYATGLGATANTGIKIANQNLSHACDSSTYVGMAIKQAGAFGGQIVQAIRTAIRAILAYLGVNQSSSGIISQLKSIAQDIKDAADFIKDITDAINGFIAYVNAIKQLLAYILSLPSVLLEYFKDCVATLKKQLVAGFKSALDSTPDPDQASIDNLQSAIKDVQGSISQFTTSVTTLAATTTQAALSLVTPSQLAIANTQQQAAATQAVYSAAGFSPTSMSKP